MHISLVETVELTEIYEKFSVALSHKLRHSEDTRYVIVQYGILLL